MLLAARRLVQLIKSVVSPNWEQMGPSAGLLGPPVCQTHGTEPRAQVALIHLVAPDQEPQIYGLMWIIISPSVQLPPFLAILFSRASRTFGTRRGLGQGREGSIQSPVTAALFALRLIGLVCLLRCTVSTQQ